MALVTAADVRQAGLPQLTGTNEDTKLDALIAQAEAALARWLFFPRADDGTYALEDKTYTFRLEGPEADTPRDLKLPIRPLVSITSVHQDADESYGTSVASSDYLGTDAELLARGILRLAYTPACGGWLNGGPGYRPIKVVVVAGWATAPAYVTQAIAWQVQHALGQGRTGVKSAGGETVRGGDVGIDPRAADLLSADRLWGNACG